MDELIEAFDIHRINKSPGIFDPNKLEWMNSQYVSKMDFDRYLSMATPWFDKVLAGRNIDYTRLAELMQSRTDIFSRIPAKIRFLAEMPSFDVSLYTNKKMKCDINTAREVLPLVLAELENIDPWTEQIIHDTMISKISSWGLKNGKVLWPMRIAISGMESTPGGAFEIAYLLGKKETLARIEKSIHQLDAMKGE